MAVAMEGSDDVAMDINVRTGTAYMAVTEKLGDPCTENEDEDNVATMGILSGSVRSQFEATFFMAAYSFLFPYSIGAPDLKYQPKDRPL